MPPTFGGTVTTPDTPQPPSNYITKMLDEAQTREDIVELQNHARQHGYSEEGQTMQLIKQRLLDFDAKGGVIK